MNFELWRAGKPLITILARFWQFTRVRSPMHGQMRNMLVGFFAMWTLVWSWIRMPLNVQPKCPLVNEFLAAYVACEIALFGMDDDVMVEQWFRTESFVAMWTHEFEIDTMCGLMSTMAAKWTQHFAAFIAHMLRVLATNVTLQCDLTAAFCVTNFTEKMNGSQMLLQCTSTVAFHQTFLWIRWRWRRWEFPIYSN